MENLLSVKAARSLIRQALQTVETEMLPFDDANGRVLARPVVSPIALPPFSSSAMDGYAVRAADFDSASGQAPVQIEVTEELAAGHAGGRPLPAGDAFAISTGAALPDGADAVVPVEWAGYDAAAPGPLPYTIRITQPVQVGQYVRPAGGALAAGELVLPAGRRLRPADIGMLASIGQVEVEVHRRPRVALFSSGDELVEPGRPLGAGQIHDSNRYALAAAVEEFGAEALRLPVASDTPEQVRQRLEAALEWRPDLILSSAGVSVGEHDHVRPVVEQAGELSFWKVNVRPGKPLAFGHYQGVPFLGLPGNPVSMLVTFELFVRPALAELAGLHEELYTILHARLHAEVHSDGRESYLRAIVYRSGEALEARLTGNQDSGNLSSMVKANALLRVPAGEKTLPAGSEAQVYLLGPVQVDERGVAESP